MTTRAQPASGEPSGPRPAANGTLARRGRWPAARVGPLFGVVWLVYLGYPWSLAWRAPAGAARIVSLASVVAFAVVFVAGLYRMRRWRLGGGFGPRPRDGWPVLAIEAVLVVGMGWSAQEGALAGLVFMSVTAVFLLPRRSAAAAVAALVVVCEVVPRAIDGWVPDVSLDVQIVLAAVAVFGVTQVMERNAELARARTELADLAVARERERIARDVHDLLGHSLTVITVKSELAGRLMDSDPAGAAREVADIESLARAALADVRATVRGFRAVGLAGELASARAALAAVGIDAQLPTALDEVPEHLRELFAWAVREGATNVVRHSGARQCEILLTGRTLVVRDDGRGPRAPDDDARGAVRHGGTGLVGLRERAAAVGAVVSAGRSPQGGFELRIEGMR